MNFNIDCVEPDPIKKNYHKGDCEVIREELLSTDWEILQDLSADDGYRLFCEKIQTCVEKYITLVRRGCKRLKKSKWMDKNCLRSVKLKYKGRQKYVHTRHAADFEKYRKLRDICTNTVRNAKRKFEHSIVESMSVNSKAFWGYVKERTKSKSGISSLKDPDEKLIDSDTDQANLLNNFFVSVFVDEPSGELPVFNVRHLGTPVSKLVLDTDTVFEQLKGLLCFGGYNTDIFSALNNFKLGTVCYTLQ